MMEMNSDLHIFAHWLFNIILEHIGMENDANLNALIISLVNNTLHSSLRTEIFCKKVV